MTSSFDAAFRQLRELGPVYFAGRTRELFELRQLLVETTARTVALVGPTGIGKTSLARHFAELVMSEEQAAVRYLDIGDVAHDFPDALLPLSRGQLYILDELTLVSKERTDRLREIIARRPEQSRFLILSRRRIPWVDATIEIGALSLDEMRDVWESNLFSPNEDEARELFEIARGSPMLGELFGRLARDHGDSGYDLLTLLRRFRQPGLVGPDGRPLRPDGEAQHLLVANMAVANDAVLRHLDKYPEDLHKLSPREFEDLVAEVLTRQGYEVEQTPLSKDGGKDLYVASKTGLGTALYAVECKRYSQTNPVGVELVRQLYGVVQAEKLTGGILATTSRFTRGAEQFRDKVRYQLSLSDYIGIHGWIRSALRTGRPV